jgi:hypothetical protein
MSFAPIKKLPASPGVGLPGVALRIVAVKKLIQVSATSGPQFLRLARIRSIPPNNSESSS